MLAAHCPRHGRRVLVTASRIEAVARDADGFRVRFRCTCGARATTRVDRLASPALP